MCRCMDISSDVLDGLTAAGATANNAAEGRDRVSDGN